jgi:hypothetical protein
LTTWRGERRRVAVLTRWPSSLAIGVLRLATPRLDDAVHAWIDPSSGHAEEAATYRAARRHPALRGVSLVFASPSASALQAASRGGIEVWALDVASAETSLSTWRPDLNRG